MNAEEIMNKKISESESKILELNRSGNLRKIESTEKNSIAGFYERKSMNRLQTAMLIYEISKDEMLKKKTAMPKEYSDFAETVASSYYAMYYIVHSYLASVYGTKLSDDIRGVHAITRDIVIYYLVKTKKLALHLYNDYLQTLETAVEIQKLNIEDFQEEAYRYAKKYAESRDAREIFTYKVALSAEEYHAKHAIKTAEEFINTLRQLMRKI